MHVCYFTAEDSTAANRGEEANIVCRMLCQKGPLQRNQGWRYPQTHQPAA